MSPNNKTESEDKFSCRAEVGGEEEAMWNEVCLRTWRCSKFTTRLWQNLFVKEIILVLNLDPPKFIISHLYLFIVISYTEWVVGLGFLINISSSKIILEQTTVENNYFNELTS